MHVSVVRFEGKAAGWKKSGETKYTTIVVLPSHIKPHERSGRVLLGRFYFIKRASAESPDSCEMSPAPDRITPVQGMADESYSLLPGQDYQSSRFA